MFPLYCCFCQLNASRSRVAMQRANLFTLLKNSKNVVVSTSNCRSTVEHKLFTYGDEIITAKKNMQPIIALESTIITHGMPYPDNFNTALSVENIIRKQGATPATIGILNGKIHVGMNEKQIELLSRADSKKSMKCSRRDISVVISQGLNGGTTVSATMLIANLAGIPIMATGGIGGVHREADSTLDISADLMELGRTPVAVVCSGVKSILDIGKTLEYLETQGVPVIKIGNTEYFPAFYCSETHDKIKTPFRVTNSKEAAKVIRNQRELNLHTGILFAVPIPESSALDPAETESAIINALRKAESMHVTGKNITPFLLKQLNDSTDGRCLQANIALIENNAKVAAEIALELSESNEELFGPSNCTKFPVKRHPVVIGGAISDVVLQVKESEIKLDGGTYAARSEQNCGGVARNVADALIKLGISDTRLISVVGKDEAGNAIVRSLGDGGNIVERSSKVNTARCIVLIDSKGECCFVVSEMDCFAAIDPDFVRKHQRRLEAASLIVLDGNLRVDTLEFIVNIAARAKVPVWYEPTDVQKAAQIFNIEAQWQNTLHFISPNKNELLVISEFFNIPLPQDKSSVSIKDIEEIVNQLAQYIPVILTTLGSEGVLVTRAASKKDPFYDTQGKLIKNNIITSRLYHPAFHNFEQSNKIISVSGCGDCFAAGVIYGIHQNFDEETCVALGLEAAALSLKSYETVPTTLSILRRNNKC